MEATCAVLGNMEVESRLNPNAWQDDYFYDLYNDYCGYGLCQFTSAKDFLPKIGQDVETVDRFSKNNPGTILMLQLDYIIDSCQPEQGIFYPDYGDFGSNYNMSFDEFTKSTIDVKELALVFHGHYERSVDYTYYLEHQGEDLTAENCAYLGRQFYAQKWYDEFSN